jgi:cellulose synthase operon protein C
MRHLPAFVPACAVLAGCAVHPQDGTLAELREFEPVLEEVRLDDSLDRAAQSYRRYLEETPAGARTPEAMRRLADLQIEKEFGIIGDGDYIEMAAPEAGNSPIAEAGPAPMERPASAAETDVEFEQRATALALPETALQEDPAAPPAMTGAPASGPRAAIATYREILETYPYYSRRDQVLYQMARAYDELGETGNAIAVMEQLIAEHPSSRYRDEVEFRRGEYFFVRRDYRDAEHAYARIVATGPSSAYYELALYKLGWTLYKQQFYELSLDEFVAMLDYRLSNGYDFDNPGEEEERRVADTFRVISLGLSNLGGPEVVDEYFASRGQRSYADRIYANLGEFYLEKLRYQDAASVYRSFIGLNPFHPRSPLFGMRIVEIYTEGGFSRLVVDSRKAFATEYALDAEYWNYHSADEMPEVVAYLKANLGDLASYYHARYQDEQLAEEQPVNFRESAEWYRRFLASFPAAPESPGINYRLADLFMENGDFGEAAAEYERTAYAYPEHEQASAAGYAAVYAHRQNLDEATGEQRLALKRAAVTSSLRFADTFPAHEEAPIVLGAAADDLYAMKDYAVAIEAAHKLIERYPGTQPELLRSAWIVVAHASIDTGLYGDAEAGYEEVLAMTAPDDESRPAIVDGLAAAIYKQGEAANLLGDYRTAVSHFLRIRQAAPASDIRQSAEYDAAMALVKLEDWNAAAGVLEDFRAAFPGHELHKEATRQLANIYRESGDKERSAAEYERMAAEAQDPEVERQALLVAAELYEEASSIDNALRVWSSYAAKFPMPLEIALEARTKVAGILKAKGRTGDYFDELQRIVELDAEGGASRSDRSKYLASKAALVLAGRLFESFAALQLEQPFEQSLAGKQRLMDAALAAFESLVQYEVAEVTAAATWYIAEVYLEFSRALLESERPAGLSAAELSAYEMVLEEEAFPFEDRSIEVHEENFELLTVGVSNAWVRKSLDKLAVLVPGRYAKEEISTGFLGSIDSYAYRVPTAPVEVTGEESRDAAARAGGEARGMEAQVLAGDPQGAPLAGSTQ